MGMIERVLTLIFGNGSNVVKDTVEVFRENAEAASTRAAEVQGRALQQFAGEFVQTRRGRFDRIMDGVNRLPRPALALGTLGLFVSAMVDPAWFAARMQGIALVPEPLWWLLGAIVSFYFGARHQAKGQEFQRQITGTLAAMPLNGYAPAPTRGPQTPALADTGRDAALTLDAVEPEQNAALAAWSRTADRGR